MEKMEGQVRRMHAVIHGDVQGVCYRMFACEQATRLGVRGWVRNLPDGTVELLAEGEVSALSRLADACRRGPPAAMVSEVDVAHGEATGEFADFRIAH